VTDTRLDPTEDYEAAMGFRLAQSDLMTLDDLEGSKTRVTVIDVQYLENGRKCYDVGPNGCYVYSSSLNLLPKIVGLLVRINVDQNN